MDVVRPRSRIVAAAGGLTWLEPVEASTRARHTLGTFLLALLILIGGATATLLPVAAAVPATALVVAAAGWLLLCIVRDAGTRLALSGTGVHLLQGARAQQVGWAAIRGVTARRRGRRLRVVIDDGHRPVTTRASFEAAVTRRWLELVTAEARRRRLDPVVAPDGLGFTTPGS
jgi:hypothetical protein